MFFRFTKPLLQQTSSISALSKRSRHLLQTAQQPLRLLPTEYQQQQQLANDTNTENHLQREIPLSSPLTRQERKKLREAQIASFSKPQTAAPTTTNVNPLLQWKQQRQSRRYRVETDVDDVACRKQQDELSRARVETQQLLAKQSFGESQREFLETVEKELDRIVSSSSACSSSPSSHYSISDLVVLLNALQFFESSRADLTVKLFELVVDKLEEKQQQVSADIDKTQRTNLKHEDDGSNGKDDQNNSGATNQVKNNPSFLHVKKLKISLTQSCSAVAFALQYCAQSGIVKSDDMHRALSLVLNASISKEIYDDAGCYTRCLISILNFGFHDYRHRQHLHHPPSPLQNSTSSSGRSSENPQQQHQQQLFFLREYLRLLGKIPPIKLHNGSVRRQLATEFLHALSLAPFQQKEHLHSFMRRTRSYQIVELFCYIIADRRISSPSLGTRPPVSRSRIPFPEQLQRAQKLTSQLGFFFPWLDRQLVQEATMTQGVIANYGEPREDDEGEGENHEVGGETGDLDAINQGGRGGVSIFPQEYPVMNYIEAFGDEAAPEPTVSGRVSHRIRREDEEIQGESDTARRAREDYGWSVKTDFDFEEDDAKEKF